MIPRWIKQTFSLAPTPLFLILGAVSWLTQTLSVCSATQWFIPEMTVMWWVMAMAHAIPWLIWWEFRSRPVSYLDSHSAVGDKQQL